MGESLPAGPFRIDDAEAWGISRDQLRSLTRNGTIRRVLRGVYLDSDTPLTPRTRALALGLVAPSGAVVTDRTAAWLHGADILERSAVTSLPPVHAYGPRGRRVRRPEVHSGERNLRSEDIMLVGPILVTTPLRTACDVGRLLWPGDALAGIDAMLRAGVDQAELVAELDRFKGYRGIIQARALAPIASAESESPGESVLRLHWHNACLPPPVLQHWVEIDGLRYRIDLGLPDLRYGAEYDGAAFHSSPHQRKHDGERRGALESISWMLDIFDKKSVYGFSPDAEDRLRAGYLRARERDRTWLWTLR